MGRAILLIGILAAPALAACSSDDGGGGWVPGPDTTADPGADAGPDASPDTVLWDADTPGPDVPVDPDADGADTPGDTTVADADTGDDADPGCDDQVHITAGGVLDFDTHVISVSGTVTRNGEPFTPQAGARIHFASPRGGVSLPLEGEGAAQFEGELFAGTYDVAYAAPTTCDPSDTPVPCQYAVVEEGVSLQAGGSLDLDLDVVAVSGVVRLEGAPIPDGPHPRGSVELAGETTLPVEFPLEGDQEATWSGEVFAGPAYDVIYRPATGDLCADEGPLPCQAHRAYEDVPVQAPGSLDMDLDVVEVTGVVRLDGAPLVDEDAGVISFFPDVGAISFPVEGDGSYGGRLFAGSYTVRFHHRPGCTDGPAPCQKLTAHTNQVLEQDGVLDVDLARVDVTGVLTVDGEEPDGARGQIVLESEEHGDLTRSLAPTGAATWDAVLFPGVYAVQYRRAAGCDPEGDALPCHDHRLREAVSLSADGSLDLDVQPVDLTGTVTLHGAPLPEGPRGRLVFRDEPGYLEVPLPEEGPATWSARLFQGEYRVSWAPPQDCSLDEDAMPCQRTVLVPSQHVAADGALDLDLAPIEIAGKLTRDGADLDGPAGSLVFGGEVQPATFPVHSDEGGTYGSLVFPGAYDVRYEPPPSCDESSALPCQSRLLRGCPAP
ncbi:MAG: hypothetical protein ACQEXJ_21775 [Myxococcota bacterium]